MYAGTPNNGNSNKKQQELSLGITLVCSTTVSVKSTLLIRINDYVIELVHLVYGTYIHIRPSFLLLSRSLFRSSLLRANP